MKKIYILLVALLMSMCTYAQLDNLDFESWENPVGENIFSNRPTGWMWFVNNILSDQNNFVHPPDTNAQSNDYAFKLSVWYNHTKDAAIQGGPIDYRPARLKGYYKYTDNFITGPEGTVPDTAMVSVYLTTIQAWPMVIDTIGIGKVYLSQSEEYTQFIADIEYFSNEMPQAISIYLDPSLVARYDDRHYSSMHEAMVSFFTVDNLMLEGEVLLSMDDANDDNNLHLYPNPATNQLYIQDFEGTATVYDVAGKQVLSQRVLNGNALDIAALSSGTYQVHLMDGKNKQVVKFIKQ